MACILIAGCGDVGTTLGLNPRLRASGFQFHYPSYREGYAALLAKPE